MRQISIMFTVILLLTISVQAGQFLGLGPRGGYYKATDADEGQWMGGLGLRLKMGGLGFEGSIDYRQEEYYSGMLTVRSYPVMASVLIYPLPIAYGIAGFGWYNTNFDYDQDNWAITTLGLEDETMQEVGFHFGFGAELPLGSKTRIAADIRYVFLDYEFNELMGDDDKSSNFYAITITLFWGL